MEFYGGELGGEFNRCHASRAWARRVSWRQAEQPGTAPASLPVSRSDASRHHSTTTHTSISLPLPLALGATISCGFTAAGQGGAPGGCFALTP